MAISLHTNNTADNILAMSPIHGPILGYLKDSNAVVHSVSVTFYAVIHLRARSFISNRVKSWGICPCIRHQLHE